MYVKCSFGRPLHWWYLDANYFCRKSLAEKVHSPLVGLDDRIANISCRTGWIHVLICVQHPQINNVRQTDDQPKPTSSIPSLCQKQVIASQYWHVERNPCTSKRHVSKSHIQHRTTIYTVILTTSTFVIEELHCFSSFHVSFISFWTLKNTSGGEIRPFKGVWKGTFQGAKSNNLLQGLVDPMVFLQQHVQESSCMLDMDMPASIHWMLLEVTFKRENPMVGTREKFGKVLVRGWMCRPDPVGVAIFPTFVWSFVGLKSAWKAVLRCSK